MRRSDQKLLVDVVLLGSALTTFAAGLVLFTQFHMGPEPFRDSSLGLSRLAWLNLHRLSALLLTAGVAVHLALNWKAFLGWLRRFSSRGRDPHTVMEILLYATFGAVAATGLAAWFLVDGTAPLAGPVPPGRLPHGRHMLVDLHDIAGLLALGLAVHHVAHRWRQLVRGLLRRRAPAAARAA
jgi:hypothetical protein